MTRDQRRALRLAFGLGFATIATFPRQALITLRIILRIIIFPEIALLVIGLAYILIMAIWHIFVPEPRPWWRDLPGFSSPQYPANQMPAARHEGSRAAYRGDQAKALIFAEKPNYGNLTEPR